MDRKLGNTEFNINMVLTIIKKNLFSILFWIVLGEIVSSILTFSFITPKYSSNIDILVNQKANNAQVQYAAQQADLQAINTYKDVLTKPIILSPVLKEVKRTDNYQGNLSTLEKSIKVSNQTNSQVVTVTVTDKNAYVAADIANTIGKIFTKKVKKMMQVDNVTIVSKA